MAIVRCDPEQISNHLSDVIDEVGMPLAEVPAFPDFPFLKFVRAILSKETYSYLQGEVIRTIVHWLGVSRSMPAFMDSLIQNNIHILLFHLFISTSHIELLDMLSLLIVHLTSTKHSASIMKEMGLSSAIVGVTEKLFMVPINFHCAVSALSATSLALHNIAKHCDLDPQNINDFSIIFTRIVEVLTSEDIILRPGQSELLHQNAAHLGMFVMFQSDRSMSRLMCSKLVHANLLKRILPLCGHSNYGASWCRMIALMMSRDNAFIDACVKNGIVPFISVNLVQYHANHLKCIDVVLEQMLHIAKCNHFCRNKIISALGELMPFLTYHNTAIQTGLILLAMMEGEIAIMHAVLRSGLCSWINIHLCTFTRLETPIIELGLETVFGIFRRISEQRKLLHTELRGSFAATIALLLKIASKKTTVSRICNLIVSLLRCL